MINYPQYQFFCTGFIVLRQSLWELGRFQIPKPPFWIYIYLFLTVLLDPKLTMSATVSILLILEIKVKQPNFYSRGIGIIIFEILSEQFIADTMNWFLNSVFIKTLLQTEFYGDLVHEFINSFLSFSFFFFFFFWGGGGGGSRTDYF